MKNKIMGSIAASAIGDAYGARFESGILERLYWSLVAKTKDGKWRYTDDTEMSFALLQSLVKNKSLNQDELALEFANAFSNHRGYGAGTRKSLKMIKKGVNWKIANSAVFPNGSFGNGAAMRAHIIALHTYNLSEQSLEDYMKRGSEVTHSHPDAIASAMLIGWSVRHMLDDNGPENLISVLIEKLSFYQDKNGLVNPEFISKLNLSQSYLETPKEQSLTRVKLVRTLGNDPTAIGSVVTAIYFALKHIDGSLKLMIDDICNLQGDTDTIAAMAGGIWGAKNGLDAIPTDILDSIEASKDIPGINRHFSLYYN